MGKRYMEETTFLLTLLVHLIWLWLSIVFSRLSLIYTTWGCLLNLLCQNSKWEQVLILDTITGWVRCFSKHVLNILAKQCAACTTGNFCQKSINADQLFPTLNVKNMKFLRVLESWLRVPIPCHCIPDFAAPWEEIHWATAAWPLGLFFPLEFDSGHTNLSLNSPWIWVFIRWWQRTFYAALKLWSKAACMLLSYGFRMDGGIFAAPIIPVHNLWKYLDCTKIFWPLLLDLIWKSISTRWYPCTLHVADHNNWYRGNVSSL